MLADGSEVVLGNGELCIDRIKPLNHKQRLIIGTHDVSRHHISGPGAAIDGGVYLRVFQIQLLCFQAGFCGFQTGFSHRDCVLLLIKLLLADGGRALKAPDALELAFGNVELGLALRQRCCSNC